MCNVEKGNMPRVHHAGHSGSEYPYVVKSTQSVSTDAKNGQHMDPAQPEQLVRNGEWYGFIDCRCGTRSPTQGIVRSGGSFSCVGGSLG